VHFAKNLGDLEHWN